MNTNSLNADYLDEASTKIRFKSDFLTDKQAVVLSSNSHIISYTITDSYKAITLQLPFNGQVFSALFDEYDSWAYLPLSLNIAYCSCGSISQAIHISNMMVKSCTIKNNNVILVLISEH